MTFYHSDPKLNSILENLLDRFSKEGRNHLQENIGVTWIRYKTTFPTCSSGEGAGWMEKKLFYPASIVKIFYAVAIEAWIEKDLLPNNAELNRALKDMIGDSSNDATSLIVDLLTGTNSGPSLEKDHWDTWRIQRNLVNKWLMSLGWPELKGVNCCQKTWNEGPYGREKDFYGPGDSNRNALSTAAVGRILEAVMTNSILSPGSCTHLKRILARSIDLLERKSNPENQIDGFIGEGLPQGTKLWSKAGWMSEARHDAAWFCSPKGNPMLLIVFTKGKQLADDSFLLPAISRELFKIHTELDNIN